MQRIRNTKRLLCLLFVITTTIALSPPLRAKDYDKSKANKVKAAYLYNFSKFVRWPDFVFENEHTPFVIGVLGNQQFTEIIRTTVKGKKVAAHPVVVQLLHWRNQDDRFTIQHCQILFVCQSQKNQLDEIKDIIKGHPVLLVGESNDFAIQGGMIGFVIEKGKIVFEINQEALEQAALKASSKLLKLARVVWGK